MGLFSAIGKVLIAPLEVTKKVIETAEDVIDEVFDE